MSLQIDSIASSWLKLVWRPQLILGAVNKYGGLLHYMAECTSASTKIRLSSTTCDHSICFDGLQPASEYSIRLWSLSTAGWSLASPPLVTYTSSEVPSPPSKVELLVINSTVTSRLLPPNYHQCYIFCRISQGMVFILRGNIFEWGMSLILVNVSLLKESSTSCERFWYWLLRNWVIQGRWFRSSEKLSAQVPTYSSVECNFRLTK